MDNLIRKSKIKINQVEVKFQRYLLPQIDWKNRLIAVKGARGVGKTTLLLQHAALHLKNKSVLYVSMDDLFFSEKKLLDLAEDFEKQGGKYLLLDEVHKYPDWSRELKLIYDDLPRLNVVFTSSSILDIYKGESDLSRRAVSYTLKELSLREFISIQSGLELPVLSLKEILQHHEKHSVLFLKQFKPLMHFNHYLKYGAYPYYSENTEAYYQKLLNTVALILESDLYSIKNIDYVNVVKFKKLLFTIATSVPFTPNISQLSEKIEVTRNTLVYALELLMKAELIHGLSKLSKGITAMNKPDKIYLHNTNLIYALADTNAETGNLRETFFAQQVAAKHRIHLAEKGDFLVDEKYIFEVGGKNKKQKQIKEVANAYLVKDDVEIGVGNTIPLWLFGFLY